MNCVNLKKMFGKRYRVRYEESYRAEHGENARVEDPWLMVIPCRNGHISPWGGFGLVASTNHPGPVANALKQLPFTSVIREGEDGCDVLFDIRYVDAVLQIMKPRKRRRLSPEERAKRTKRLHGILGQQNPSQNADRARGGARKDPYDISDADVRLRLSTTVLSGANWKGRASSSRGNWVAARNATVDEQRNMPAIERG